MLSCNHHVIVWNTFLYTEKNKSIYTAIYFFFNFVLKQFHFFPSKFLYSPVYKIKNSAF